MITVFEVANIRCGGCAKTIIKALKEEGFDEVSVDTTCEPRKVTAKIVDEAHLAQFKVILRSLGYPLVGEEQGSVESATLKLKSFVSCTLGKIN